MEIINGANRLPALARPLFLALGNFDGVHRGHQFIFKAVVERARSENGFSAALILNPHPVIALNPHKPIPLLTDIADRAEIMAELGLDYMIIEPFGEELASLYPECFIREFLKNKLNVSGIFIGSNYKFGRQGAGSAETMHYWSKELEFSVDVSPLLNFKGKEVSSSLIRSLLLSGAVKEAADYLNYYFFRQGKIIKGYGIGGKMVYPTANISANPSLLWPGKGVYLTSVGKIGDELLYGVTNVGSRPTFDHKDPAVETHIIDFEGSIYNREMRLCFLEKLRDIRTFESPVQLKEQISLDIERSRGLMKQYKEQKNESGLSLQAGCSMLRSG